MTEDDAADLRQTCERQARQIRELVAQRDAAERTLREFARQVSAALDAARKSGSDPSAGLIGQRQELARKLERRCVDILYPGRRPAPTLPGAGG